MAGQRRRVRCREGRKSTQAARANPGFAPGWPHLTLTGWGVGGAPPTLDLATVASSHPPISLASTARTRRRSATTDVRACTAVFMEHRRRAEGAVSGHLVNPHSLSGHPILGYWAGSGGDGLRHRRGDTRIRNTANRIRRRWLAALVFVAWIRTPPGFPTMTHG